MAALGRGQIGRAETYDGMRKKWAVRWLVEVYNSLENVGQEVLEIGWVSRQIQLQDDGKGFLKCVLMCPCEEIHSG